MRALVTALSLAILLAAPAQARLVGPGIAKSWGKAGVSLARYRADAIACGERAAGTDLAGTDPARALVVASRMIDNNAQYTPGAVNDPLAGPSAAAGALDSAGSTPDAVRMIDPQRQVAKAGDILHSALDRCLAARGYREFRLTRDQQRRLRKLPLGSDARHAYLHSLASDPEILTRQAAD
jgi:hypothetical protein